MNLRLNKSLENNQKGMGYFVLSLYWYLFFTGFCVCAWWEGWYLLNGYYFAVTFLKKSNDNNMIGQYASSGKVDFRSLYLEFLCLSLILARYHDSVRVRSCSCFFITTVFGPPIIVLSILVLLHHCLIYPCLTLSLSYLSLSYSIIFLFHYYLIHCYIILFHYYLLPSLSNAINPS